jgi:ABC-2 type transport system ATP-binding protein
MTRAATRESVSQRRRPDADIVILTQGLTKTFKDFWMRARVRAVDNLDLEVRRGEIYGLLGPNGSGKSTTIKILLGLLHKTSGRVTVLGKNPSDVAVKDHIGVLPEESYLYPFLNAYETLDFYAKLFELERSVRKRRIAELLDMVGLTATAHRQIKEYSKGMQRRIGLAQALINDPELLILDEPTTGLDPLGTRQVKDLITELGRRGKTILLSSHQLTDVEDVADRLTILYGGRKQAEGTPDELLTASSHTLIETDELDDETIAELDDILRARAGRSIHRVSKPRQKLEDLFVDIVEKARSTNLATGGALSGGATAAFLKQDRDAEDEGERVIERLVEEPAPPQPAPEPTPAAARAETDQQPATPEDAQEDAVIDDLLAAYEDAPRGAQNPEQQTEAPEPPEGADDSVIEGLLGGDDDKPEQRG